MMKVDDAPLSMKSVGVLLILTSIIDMLFIFVTALDSNYIYEIADLIVAILLVQALFCFVMIWMAYGLMIKKRWCYFVWMIMAIVNTVWVLININGIVKYLISAMLLIDIAVLSLVPRVRDYCLDREVQSAGEVPDGD